jgi:hypothetical protein
LLSLPAAQWGPSVLVVGGKEYVLLRIHFMPCAPPAAAEAS